MMPTMSIPEPKIASTVSLKKKPTMATGIIEIRMLMAKCVPSFKPLYDFHDCLANRSLKIQTTSFQRMTSVLHTVAIWTTTVKVRFSSPDNPKRVDAMVRWPLLLTGRNSVSPCRMPKMIA